MFQMFRKFGIIAHYTRMVENLSKFLKTNKFGYKSCGFEQKIPQNARIRNQKANREAHYIQLETVDAHAPGHVRTIVRREHQARTHVRTSEESSKRTCAHPAGITSTEPGGLARPRKTICKRNRFVNDLERTTDILCLWYALIAAQSRIALAAAIVRITARCAR
jgi:hypothetical protein